MEPRARLRQFPLAGSRSATFAPRLILSLAAATLIAAGPGCTRDSERRPPPGPPPRIEVVYPERGAPDGGDRVTVYTSGFAGDFQKETPVVHFGTARAKAVPLSSFSLEVEAPPGVDGPVDIVVRDPATEESAVLSRGFSYDDGPAVPLPDLTIGGGPPPATLPGAPDPR